MQIHAPIGTLGGHGEKALQHLRAARVGPAFGLRREAVAADGFEDEVGPVGRRAAAAESCIPLARGRPTFWQRWAIKMHR